MTSLNTALRFARAQVEVEQQANGSAILRSPEPLRTFARASGEWLVHWAGAAPDRTFLGERSGDDWRRVTYADALHAVRRIGGSLLARGLTPSSPVADPVRQLREPRAAGSWRDACRHSGCANLAGLLADVEGSSS
jgi:hypothetical protein